MTAGGLGYSSTGWNGPYNLAMTADGAFVADFITSGALNANIIKSGTLQSLDGETFYLDLEGGTLNMKATDLTISGKTPKEIADESADTALDSAKSYTDDKTSATLSNAQDYAKSAAATSLANAKSYTDSSASTTLSSAQSYADTAASGAIENYDYYLNQQKIFNRLTNNGETQGIYLKDGKIYINLEYIQATYLRAANVGLDGLFSVYNGSTKGGNIGYMQGANVNSATDGIAMTDSTIKNYVIVTTSGVRLQTAGARLYITEEGVTVDGNLSYTGTLQKVTN
jgi:hypothetical protein